MSPGDHVDRERVLGCFLDLVRIDSPSGDEAAIGTELEGRLAALGLAVERDGAGNLLARADGGDGETLLLSAHMDTAGRDRGIRPVVQDGVVRSDGTTILGADDKAGIAAILEALVLLQANPGWPRPPLEVLITVEEERGLAGARAFDRDRLRAAWAVVLDQGGPIGTITSAAPASRYVTATITGRRAHAGVEPEKGVSAIQVAAEAIAALELGRLDHETVANIGRVEGGEARNVVADRVVCEGMARSHDPAKLERVVSAMQGAFEAAAARRGARAEVVVEPVYEHYAIDLGSPAVRALERAYAAIGRELRPGPAAGGSDANILNARGLTSVVVSTGMTAVHTSEEHIAVADLVDAARALVTLLVQQGG